MVWYVACPYVNANPGSEGFHSGPDMSRGVETGGVLLSTYQMPRRTPEVEHCRLSHDMSNCVSIILGECELLLDLISNNAKAMERA